MLDEKHKLSYEKRWTFGKSHEGDGAPQHPTGSKGKLVPLHDFRMLDDLEEYTSF